MENTMESTENVIDLNTQGTENKSQAQSQSNEGEQKQAVPSNDDLISRVTRFQKEHGAKEQVKVDDDSSFDLKELESITDPTAKEQAMKAYKSFQRGFNEKFKELAELKKQLQSTQPQTQAQQQWTADRVRQLTQDPDFLRAAQEVAGGDISMGEEDNDTSMMTPQERQRMSSLEKEINSLKQMNMNALRQQQHAQYKEKYANYDPQEIDQITADMMAGKINSTPEHIYWAMYGPQNAKDAYEMGLKDGRSGVSDKIQSMSADGIQTNHSQQALTPEKDEDNMSFWRRIVQKNMQASMKR